MPLIVALDDNFKVVLDNSGDIGHLCTMTDLGTYFPIK